MFDHFLAVSFLHDQIKGLLSQINFTAKNHHNKEMQDSREEKAGLNNVVDFACPLILISGAQK